MPHLGLLFRIVERESVAKNWKSVLRLLDRMEVFADPARPIETEFLLYHRGYALLELNRHDEAVRSLRRLVEIDGSTAHYRLLFADSLIRMEEWKEAFRQLEAGLQSEPDHPGCLCAMGWALYQVGDKKSGKGFLARAAELHPGYYPAHLDLGLIHAAEGRWATSEAHLEAALEVAPADGEILDVLDAVRENRSRAELERRRIRELWPLLRRRRQALSASELDCLRKIRKGLQNRGASHLAILLAESLWMDFADSVAERPAMDSRWAASVTYACEWLHGRKTYKADVAREWGVTTATLARRLKRLVETLRLEPYDPRYSSEIPTEPLLDTEAEVCEPMETGAHPSNSRVIPVDFVRRERLPKSTPCPCGSGHAVWTCPHGPTNPRNP